MDGVTPAVRSQAFEEAENVGRNASPNPTLGEVIAGRYGRRDLLKGALAVTAIAGTLGPLALAAAREARAAAGEAAAGEAFGFNFTEIAAATGPDIAVAPGHKAQVLVRWGDPVLPGAAPFDPHAQSAATQARQFGYNNDYLGFLPIDGSSGHGLLVVNHEYTNEELMFPGVGTPQETAPSPPPAAPATPAASTESSPQTAKEAKPAGPAAPPGSVEAATTFARMTLDLVAIEMMAHGGSVLEIRRGEGGWAVVAGSRYARRITAETPMTLAGPAAGHPRLRTAADPSGARVMGMVNNCAGGITPWGTWLSCEENFNGYFWGKVSDDHPEARNYERYGVAGNAYAWGRWHDRFDVGKEPNEANRFGWVVEIDPFEPDSTPKKRTALGRFKHEGAAGLVNRDGRYVVYMGDDERFDYIYRFVSEAKVDPADRAANRDLLDRGTLAVARFADDGAMEWLPLVHGEGPLTAANGFMSQADVLIETRRAADLLGATKMDRPEDVEADPRSGKVYAMLTNNDKRKAGQTDAANPRPENRFGHIIEMTAPDGDHAAARYAWDVLLRCGDPAVAAVGATFAAGTTANGWFGMPDNCAVDSAGRLWVATDGNSPKATGRNDGIWAVETRGERRGLSKHFFSVPVGAEMCGPMFTPDGRTMFLAVQHPGEEDAGGKPGSFASPATRWPDFEDGVPPRPAVVVITKDDGGVVGA